MKRVLIFSLNYYPRFIGGAEVAIKEITDRLDPNEFEFHLLSLRVDSNLSEEERLGNVYIHRIGAARPDPSIGDLKKFPLHYLKHWYQFGAVPAALRLHRKYKFDIIWAMMAHSCGIPAGLFKMLKPKVTYVLTLQEGDPPEHIERLARPVWPLFVMGFKKADILQPISTYLLTWGKNMGFKGKGTVIPNGVDYNRFAKEIDVSEIKEEQNKLGKKEGEVWLVTTSRLVHKNAVDDVIRALTLLPENIHFAIFGIGPLDEELKQLAKELHVENRAHFFGAISHEEMPRALKSCDIFIRPSRSEGMGNSFVEAMAADIPVIATQEGGISDFLFDAKRNPEKQTTGWAVDADSPEQIAAATNEIISQPEKVKEVIAYAKTMVREKYNWDTIAREMGELFELRNQVQ